MKSLKKLILFLLLSFSLGYAQTHFTFTSNTGSNATVVIPSNINPNINGVVLESGDEIGAFSSEGLCVGAVVWDGENAALTVWGDNSQTSEIDGLVDGETIYYRIWDSDRELEIDSISFAYSSGDGVFHTDAFMILSQLNGFAAPGLPMLISPEDLAVDISIIPQFKWQNINAESYDIQVASDNEFNNIVISNSGITDTSYTSEIQLKYLHNYFWRVRGINSIGFGQWSEPFSFTTKNREQSHFVFTSNTGNNATVTIPASIEPNVNGEPIEIGDEIGAFTPAGLCVGAIVWAGSNTAVTVWGDDSQTSEIDGIQEGEQINYRIWKYTNDEEYVAVGEYSTGDGIYHSDGFYVLSSLTGIVLPEVVSLYSPKNDSLGIIGPVELMWSSSNYAENYKLQVSTDENFTSTIIDTSGLIDTTFMLNNLDNLTNYYWRVKAVNVGGESEWSEVWTFRTLGEPTTVEAVYPENNAVNVPIELTFVWTKAEDQLKPVVIGGGVKGREGGRNGSKTVGSYWFELTNDINGSSLIVDSTLTDTTKSVIGLENLTDYWWRVRAKNEAGWGEYSQWYKFTTIVDTPSVVSLVAPGNNSVGNVLPVVLKWNVSELAESYALEVSTDANFATMVIDTSGLADTTFTLSELDNLTNYYWRVKAVNVGGESQWSEAWTFRTLGEPTVVNAVYPENDAVNVPIELTFIWTKAEDQFSPVVIGGRVKEKGNSFRIVKGGIKTINDTKTIGAYWFELTKDTSGTAVIVDTTLTDTTKYVNGLENLTNYWWRVRAKNETGWGEFTSWSKFTTLGNLDIVFSDDFENGTGQWQLLGGWGLTESEFVSPTHSLTESPNGNYPDNAVLLATMNEGVDLSDVYDAQVEFMTKYEIEQGFDYMYVDITYDGAKGWTTLTAFDGVVNEWTPIVIPIGGYVGNTGVKIRFRFVSDAGYNMDGMYIDDFKIRVSNEDTTPPLVSMSCPQDYEGVMGDYVVDATITDISGVALANLIYTTVCPEPDPSDIITTAADSVDGDNYYFHIHEQEAGTLVCYTLVVADSVGNIDTLYLDDDPCMYIAGNYINYDDNEVTFVLNIPTNFMVAKRLTVPDSKEAHIVTALIRNYTDSGRPNGNLIFHIWKDNNGVPGEDYITPFEMEPAANLENPYEMTVADLRDVQDSIFVVGDFWVGFSVPGDEVWLTLGRELDDTRSYVYDPTSGQWAMYSREFQFRAIAGELYEPGDVAGNALPKKFELMQNYPNPFNPTTVIKYALPKDAHVNLKVYNVLGQEVATLVDNNVDAGYHEVNFDASQLSSGIYIYRIEAGKYVAVKKMMLLK